MARDSVLMDIINAIQNGAPYPVYDAQTRWALQYYVSSRNDSLTAATGYENAKAFATVDGAMSRNDYGSAQTLLNAISPNNTVESNWQVVDNILIKLQNDTLNSSDVSALQSVAQQCPLTGGSIVYNARALLNNYYNNIIHYTDNCNDNNNNRTAATAVNKIAVNKNQLVTVYPNPNNGDMTVGYNLQSDAQLQITDITGKTVGIYKLNAAEKSTAINMKSLINGVYYIP